MLKHDEQLRRIAEALFLARENGARIDPEPMKWPTNPLYRSHITVDSLIAAKKNVNYYLYKLAEEIPENLVYLLADLSLAYEQVVDWTVDLERQGKGIDTDKIVAP